MPGEIVSLPRAEYDRQTRVNWSTLRLMLKSPAHYRHGLLADQVDTDPEEALASACRISRPSSPIGFAQTLRSGTGPHVGARSGRPSARRTRVA